MTTRAVRDGACRVAVALALVGALPQAIAATYEPAPQRRAVFLLGPPAGYTLPGARQEFGAVERSRCLVCHGLPSFVARDSASGEALHLSVDSVAFGRSAHGALACTQCHPDVKAYPHVFTGGRRPDVGCDADCHARDAKGRPVRHADTVREYRESVHADGLRGEPGQPDCAYCHGAGDPHAAGRVRDEFPPLARVQACASCHENRERMARDSVAVDAVASYRAGLHFAALRLGEAKAATCLDCHDTHGVRRARDPESTTHASRLAATCGRDGCHRGAGPRFAASGTDHMATLERRSAPVRAASAWFGWGGLAVMLAFALGVLLDVVRPVGRPRTGEAAGADGTLVPRLPLVMRLQHGLLVASFTVLALTGLPIRFPASDAFRAWGTALGGWESLRVAHRVAAIAMGVALLAHLVWALARLVAARGNVARAWPILPVARDVREAGEALRYHVGGSDAPPAHGAHEFRAKVHYLAVLWGVPAMAATGLLLGWASSLAEALPARALAVALRLHADEALLAIGVVIVWHFYNVHFAPGRGLRFWTWLDGRVTALHQRRQHGAAASPTARTER